VLEQRGEQSFTFRRLLSFERGAGQGALGRGLDGRVSWYWPGNEATTATPIDLEVAAPTAVDGGD
jgi:hypothetical protein